MMITAYISPNITNITACLLYRVRVRVRLSLNWVKKIIIIYIMVTTY